MNRPQNKELPYLYKSYLKTCRLLELIGGVILIGTILLNEFLHLETRGFVIPAALIAFSARMEMDSTWQREAISGTTPP